MRETNENLDSYKSSKRLVPSVYVSYMSQNFLLFYVSKLSARKLRIFLLMYPESLSDVGARSGCRCYVTCPVRGCGWGGSGVGGGGGGSRVQSAMLIHVTFKFGIDGSGKGRHCLTL